LRRLGGGYNPGVTALNPTPDARLVDERDRPYFLWDTDLTRSGFERVLREGSDVQRAHMIAKLMRQAKPDDVFTFVSLARIRADWSRIEPALGNAREFWAWLLDEWDRSDA